MNINQLVEMAGQDVGLEIRSLETDRVLRITAKTVGGNYVVTRTDGTNKEALVSGAIDRYDFVTPEFQATIQRRQAIKERLAVLEVREIELNNELDTVMAEVETLEDELEGLGNEHEIIPN